LTGHFTDMSMLTVTDWAASMGISKQAGYQAVKRCAIPVVDGKVDSDIATMLYRRGTRVRANAKRQSDAGTGTPAPEAGPPISAVVSYDEARRRREAAEAAMAELKLAELAGTLVLRDKVNRTIFGASRVMRDQLLAMAPRLAATLAPITDAKTIELRIDEEIRVALRAFAQQLREGGPEGAGDGQPG
jgi:hypothetical protein